MRSSGEGVRWKKAKTSVPCEDERGKRGREGTECLEPAKGGEVTGGGYHPGPLTDSFWLVLGRSSAPAAVVDVRGVGREREAASAPRPMPSLSTSGSNVLARFGKRQQPQQR